MTQNVGTKLCDPQVLVMLGHSAKLACGRSEGATHLGKLMEAAVIVGDDIGDAQVKVDSTVGEQTPCA